MFPPPLIITRNAHGAEEGEGLGTRLQLSCTIQLRRALFGHVLCTWLSDRGAALLLTAKTDQNLHMRISLKVTSASAGEDALIVTVASYSA